MMLIMTVGKASSKLKGISQSVILHTKGEVIFVAKINQIKEGISRIARWCLQTRNAKLLRKLCVSFYLMSTDMYVLR